MTFSRVTGSGVRRIKTSKQSIFRISYACDPILSSTVLDHANPVSLAVALGDLVQAEAGVDCDARALDDGRF